MDDQNVLHISEWQVSSVRSAIVNLSRRTHRFVPFPMDFHSSTVIEPKTTPFNIHRCSSMSIQTMHFSAQDCLKMNTNAEFFSEEFEYSANDSHSSQKYHFDLQKETTISLRYFIQINRSRNPLLRIEPMQPLLSVFVSRPAGTGVTIPISLYSNCKLHYTFDSVSD